MALEASFEAAIDNLIAASGGRVWKVSGYRDTEHQRRLWEEKLAEYGLPPDTDPDDPRAAEARNYVAPPGGSNHERGIAMDLGGDLELAAQLAPQFGLWLPMSWEPWHFEPIGSREAGSPKAYTTTPAGAKGPAERTAGSSYTDVLNKLIGSVSIFNMSQPAVPGLRQSVGKANLDPARKAAPVFTSSTGGPDGIDAFMRAIKAQESQGWDNPYEAIGQPTEWGRATGAYQFLDGTWGGYGGYARAMDAPPELQDQRAREMMQEYYNQYGDWDSVAAAWFSGPGGNWQSNEVQTYVSEVKGRL